MKKRMMKKNLKKNREKNRNKNKEINVPVQATAAEMPTQELPIPKRPQIPVDAKDVEENVGWEYYLSPDGKSVYLKTTEYHPDPIRLTTKHLERFINLIKGSKNG